LKKLTGSVRFRFYKPETRKNEPNPNRKNRAKPKKRSQTEKNRAKPKKPSQTGLNWFQFGFFLIKTEPK